MADRYFEDFPDVGADEPGLGVQKAMNWFGGCVSFSLVLGLAIWSYQLVVRDVSAVPVVRALEGPARIAPADPGGRQTAHQGLSVNRIAALGEAAPPPESVILAPRPVLLTDEDRPMVAAVAQRDASQTGNVVLVSLRTDGLLSGADDLAADKEEQFRALSEETATAGIFGTALDAALAEALGAERTVVRSPRPRSRPGNDQLASAAPLTEVESLSTPVAPINPDDLPVGTRLVQLGAFDDVDLAAEEWDKLALRFSAYLEGRQRIIQPAESNGRAFFRLRAYGFADEGDARRFCAALLAERANCIPVMIR